MNGSSYNVIDLFCGCGGLSLGFEHAGFNILLGIDSEKIALETFEKNHHNARTICGDITSISYNNIRNIIKDKEIDVIIGGPPCQGMSLAGSRQLDDPRNKLYLSYVRLVGEIRPKMFVLENVPSLLTLFNGVIKDSIITEFQKLGYNIQYKILCSADYYVPQSRKRVVFVGKRITSDFVYPLVQEEYVSCGEALSDLPPLIDNLGTEVSDYYAEPMNNYQKKMRKGSDKVYNHIASAHSKNVQDTIALIPAGANYKDLPKDYNSTRNFHIAWTRFPKDKPAPTIDTGHRHHFHYKYNRVPTVRECARIQSFPDTFIFHGNKTEQFRQ